MSAPRPETHFIVLPGGGYEGYAENEGEPIVGWLGALGITASVLRYPLHARHPIPLDAVRSEVRRLRAMGVARVGAIGFSAAGHLAGHAALSDASNPRRRLWTPRDPNQTYWLGPGAPRHPRMPRKRNKPLSRVRAAYAPTRTSRSRA